MGYLVSSAIIALISSSVAVSTDACVRLVLRLGFLRSASAFFGLPRGLAVVGLAGVYDWERILPVKLPKLICTSGR